MEEKDFNKKLDNLELPDIEITSHRHKLRTDLLASEYANKENGAGVFTKVSGWLKDRIDIAVNSLTPRRLSLKPALVTALAIALIISISVVIPPLVNQTHETLVKIDDWTLNQYDPLDPNATSGATIVTCTQAGSSINIPAPTVIVGLPPDINIGLATGGAMDINNFRENIANDYLPLPTDMTYEGLFYDYYFDTGQAEKCDDLFCPSYSFAVTDDPFSGETEYYLSVGLNSGIKENDFQRKKLNLVIVLDISGSMSSGFGKYYYDHYGEKVELSEEEQGMEKIEAAKEAVAALLGNLENDDRFGMVLFDRQAYLAKPLNLVGETDMEAIEEHILEIEADGGTNLYAGMEMATDLFADLTSADQSEYENRIIFLTDAMPNTGETGEDSFSGRLEQNAENHLYSTFIGIGVDFNSELVESITKTRGANYYSVHAPEQFKERMDDEFEYMVTPLVFNLQLTLEAEGWEIEKVYGSPEADEATGGLMKINTLFPSKSVDGETKGGLVLLKLKRTAEDNKDNSLVLKVSYEDRNGNQKNIEATVTFNNEEPEYFANDGIRKGVLLTRYADLVKNWLVDEYEHTHISYLWEPKVNYEDGIIIPPATLGQWERQSLPLYVSPPYRDLFRQFSQYFQGEAEAIGDATLAQELDILELLSSE